MEKSAPPEQNGVQLPGGGQVVDDQRDSLSQERPLLGAFNHRQMNGIEPSLFPAPPLVKHASDANVDLPEPSRAVEIALAALQYLPTPLIVLNSRKTILLANGAMARLLGLDHKDLQGCDRPSNNSYPASHALNGQNLSQIGVDIVQDGVPVWVSWDKFLDNLAFTLGDRRSENRDANLSDVPSEDTTPLASPSEREISLNAEAITSPMERKTVVHDTVIDVVVSTQQSATSASSGRNRHHKPRSPAHQTPAKMIVSIWHIEDERFFSLSFTSTSLSQAKPHSRSHLVSRAPFPAANSHLKSDPARSSTPTSSRSSSTHSSVVTSPSDWNFSASSPFPPLGAPSKCHQPETFSDFQKVTRMKDAMLSAMEIPVLAMWKDETVVFPNPAARRMLAVVADPTTEDSYDFISRFKAYTADFEREMRHDEYPITSLCRQQKGFTNWKIGMLESQTGKRRNYDVSGKPVFDEETGEFFAGLVAFKDVTEYTEKLASQSEENEQQFKLICDSMPQMLWTTRPDGYHDYFPSGGMTTQDLVLKSAMVSAGKPPFILMTCQRRLRDGATRSPRETNIIPSIDVDATMANGDGCSEKLFPSATSRRAKS